MADGKEARVDDSNHHDDGYFQPELILTNERKLKKVADRVLFKIAGEGLVHQPFRNSPKNLRVPAPSRAGGGWPGVGISKKKGRETKRK